MYNIYDTASAIRNVQEWLYFLSKTDYGISTVYPDGIYGDETVTAVKEFQAKQRIEQTGIVDFETFVILRLEYNKALREFNQPEKVRIFPRLLLNNSINPGERFATVSVIQAMILSLATVNDEFDKIVVNGIYDENTERAVNVIKNIFGLEEDSLIDKKFFSALTKLYESFIDDDM